jgi:hypothetical protein
MFALLAAITAFAQEPAKVEAPAVPSSFRSYIVMDKRTYDGEPKIVVDPVNMIAKHVYVKDPKRDPKNRTEKMHDLVSDNALNPTLAVFCRSTPKAEDALAKLTLELRRILRNEKYKAMNFGAYVVFLTLDKDFQLDDKRDEADAAIFNWGTEVGKDNPPAVDPVSKKKLPGGIEGVVLGLAGKSSEPVKAWDIGDNDDVTVVLYHRLKVVQRWKFEAGKFGDDDAKAIIEATEAELKKK